MVDHTEDEDNTIHSHVLTTHHCLYVQHIHNVILYIIVQNTSAEALQVVN